VKEKHKLQVSENKVLRISELQGNEASGKWMSSPFPDSNLKIQEHTYTVASSSSAA
jgi:hypothetical protein